MLHRIRLEGPRRDLHRRPDAAGARPRHRNGTFLNRESVKDGPLHDGDVLHVSDYKFGVARSSPRTRLPGADGAILRTAPLGRHFRLRGAESAQLIERHRVTIHSFQPIVTAARRRASPPTRRSGAAASPTCTEPVKLFEPGGALRSRRRGRAQPPVQAQGRQARSSTLPSRRIPVREGRRAGSTRAAGARRVARGAPGLRSEVDLVLEIHESASPIDFVAWLRNHLLDQRRPTLTSVRGRPGRALRAGRSAAPLPEVRPTLRRRGSKGACRAAPRRVAGRRRRELLVKTLAEGVENAEEADACRRAGFSLAQGYHFARPMPIEKIA